MDMLKHLRDELLSMFRQIGGRVPDRDIWPNGRIAFLSLLGYSVGFGNFTNFPLNCHIFGGASFIVAYILMVLLIGIPIYFVEISLGQYVSQGPTYVFTHIAPIARGLGWGMLWLSFITSMYYNEMMGWILYYLYSATNIHSYPWDNCNNTFNTPKCYTYCTENCDMSTNSTDYTNKTISAMEFFRYGLLNKDESSNELGSLQPHLLLCMAITWSVMVLCLSAGIKNKERILTFIVVFPYIVLGLMLIVVLQLPGSGKEAYIGKLDAKQLLDYKLWEAAGIQVLYSTGVGFGGITTIASYNNLRQNTLRDGIIVPLLNGLTSFIAGFIIFCVLGDMAKSVGMEIEEVLDADHGIALVIFTNALSRMPCGWNVIWTVLFLIMIIMVGFSSSLPIIAAFTTAIFDHFEALRNYKLATLGSICLILFISNIPLCTRNGVYLYDFLNKYTIDPSILILVLLEVLVVSYCYGFNRFMKDVEETMAVWVPRPIKYYLLFTLCYITPLLLMLLLVCSIVVEAISPCSESSWICEYQNIGTAISYSSLFIIVSFGIYVLIQKKVGSILRPTNQFVPEEIRRKNFMVENGVPLPGVNRYRIKDDIMTTSRF